MDLSIRRILNIIFTLDVWNILLKNLQNTKLERLFMFGKLGTSSQSAADILKDVWSDKIEWMEEFVLLLLNNSNQPLGYVKLFQGGLNHALADSRVIFGIALVAQASGFIISHNHPSGGLTPSQADKNLTQNLLTQGRIMGINLLDHIIITKKGYFSFKDSGLIY